MKEIHILTELEHVKVLADPLRVTILEAIYLQPMTTKQVAKLIGETPTKLYHHMTALEKAGIVELVETKQNRGTVEKYYQSVAKKFAIDQQLFKVAPQVEAAVENLQSLFASTFEATMAEVNETINAKMLTSVDQQRAALLTRFHIAGTQTEIDKLIEKLQLWIDECRATSTEQGERKYGVTVAFYPIQHTGPVAKKAAKKATKGKTKNNIK